MTDKLGERMKGYELMESGRNLIPLLPAMARIDGRCFSQFTRDMRRPYDERLSKLMVDTTIYLAKETNACLGYTQSDEISLCWLQTDEKSEIYFNGRIQKMVSQLAAMTSVYFNQRLPDYFTEDNFGYSLRNRSPTFDCRVWNVPNVTEGANTFLWREFDATRNSIQMAAQAIYSHKELHGRNSSELQDMLHKKGINWNDYPAFFKRGSYVQRRIVLRKFTAEEMTKLPVKHEAHANPNLVVERNDCNKIDMPPFSKVVNRPDVVFYGGIPMVLTNEEI